MSDVRRFNSLERTVADTARRLDDKTSTLFARVASHAHSAAEVVSGVFDVARLPIGRTSSTVPAGDHGHSRDVVGETRLNSVSTVFLTASSTAFVNAGLSFNVSANAEYLYEAHLFYGASATADFRIATSGPTNYGGRMVLHGRDTSSTTGGIATSTWSAGLVSDQPSVGGIGNSTVLYASLIAEFTTSSTAGTFSLFFGQAASDTSNATRLYSNSFARITRIA